MLKASAFSVLVNKVLSLSGFEIGGMESEEYLPKNCLVRCHHCLEFICDGFSNFDASLCLYCCSASRNLPTYMFLAFLNSPHKIAQFESFARRCILSLSFLRLRSSLVNHGVSFERIRTILFGMYVLARFRKELVQLFRHSSTLLVSKHTSQS